MTNNDGRAQRPRWPHYRGHLFETGTGGAHSYTAACRSVISLAEVNAGLAAISAQSYASVLAARDLTDDALREKVRQSADRGETIATVPLAGGRTGPAVDSILGGNVDLNSGDRGPVIGALVASWFALDVADPDGTVRTAIVPASDHGLHVTQSRPGFGLASASIGNVYLDPDRYARLDSASQLQWQQQRSARLLLHAAFDYGVARSVLIAGLDYLTAKARAWREAPSRVASEDPLVLERVGGYIARAHGFELLIGAAANDLDAQSSRPSAPELSASFERAEYAYRYGCDFAAEIASGLIELLGASASDRQFHLDRYWRDVKVHCLLDRQSLRAAPAGAQRLNGRVNGLAGGSSRMSARKLHLNVNVLSLGSHPAAWRVSPAGPRGYLGKEYYQELARIAERGFLDAFFLADALTVSPNPAAAPSWSLDPTIVAVAMAEVTQHLGFIVTASTTFDNPYNLARRFSSLDHVTNGRVGWNVVTTYDEPAAANFGLDQLPPRPDRYGRADEFVEVVLKLWDSWEDDAIIADVDTGVFADASRIHAVEHVGQRFTVRGPLQIPRSPQGRLLLVQAGASEGGRALAGKYADAVFASQLSIKAAREYYADIKSRVSANGRDPDQVAILPGLSLVIGSTEAEAWARKNELDELAGGTDQGLRRLAGRLGIEPDQLSLDRPIPPELLGNARNGTGAYGFADATVALILNEQPTVRELILQGGGGHRLVIGAAEQIANTIEEWFNTRACDGFNIMFDVYPTGLEAFVDHVVPELQRRGIYRTSYDDDNLLRSRYGLSRPQSAYSAVDALA